MMWNKPEGLLKQLKHCWGKCGQERRERSKMKNVHTAKKISYVYIKCSWFIGCQTAWIKRGTEINCWWRYIFPYWLFYFTFRWSHVVVWYIERVLHRVHSMIISSGANGDFFLPHLVQKLWPKIWCLCF